ERTKRAMTAAGDEARREFDLSRGPMLRTLLIRLGSHDHLLVLTMHHIASDGWSSEVVLAELAAHYARATGVSSTELRPVPFQYTDFAAWQSRTAQGSAFDQSLAYWRERLSGAPALLALAPDRSRPSVQGLQGTAEHLALSKEVGERLKALARAERATLFMT